MSFPNRRCLDHIWILLGLVWGNCVWGALAWIQEESLPASSLLPEDKYSIGEPTDNEQAFVEYINRARANANQEAFWLANTQDPHVVSALDSFGTNLLVMQNEFALLQQTLPPLSINDALTQAARLHTLDMFTNMFQEHLSSENTPDPFLPGYDWSDRISAFGYSWTRTGENISSYSKSVLFAHAGFNIDWGSGEDGMQAGRGHRMNIHDNEFREIGVGVVVGSNYGEDYVGSLLVTQDFATPASPVPFLTGVAYYDLNGNAFYDAGEGISGIVVETLETAAWAETAASGGYSVPLNGDGVYNVTFSGPNLAPVYETIFINSAENLKLDLVLPYTAPEISGSSTPHTGTVVISASFGYEVIQSGDVNSGLYAFHLAHPQPFSNQIIELGRIIIPTTGSELQFASKLQYATYLQIAYVEVSTDGGNTWNPVYSQVGTTSQGELSFESRTIPLEAFAGMPIRVRFRYENNDYSFYYSQTTINVGWLIDDITVTNSTTGTVIETFTGPETGFAFTPAAIGEFAIACRPVCAGRILPFGEVLRVSAQQGTPIEIWRMANFLPADLADPAKEAPLWGDEADPDKDGFKNIMEYALNGNPNLPDAAGIAPVFTRDGNFLKLAYTKFRDDVTYRVLSHTSLRGPNWTTSGVVQTPNPDTSPEGTAIEASAPMNGRIRFLKLHVNLTGSTIPTEIEFWRATHFLPVDLADPAKEALLWGDEADPDLDGINNLMEFALNGDPNLPDVGLIAPVFSREAGSVKLSYTMYRSDVTYRVWTSTMLDSGWTTTGVSQLPDPDPATEGTLIEAAAALDGERRFLRFEVTLP
jgi:hypothetical protein